MTSQSVVAFVGNSSMSRVFIDTATDGQFGGNLLLSQNASQNLGLEMPNVMIDFLSMTYTASLAIWRIIDSVTQRVERWGLCSKVGYVCSDETKIAPFKVKPTSLLEVYPMQSAAGANDTACLGWIRSGDYAEPFTVTTTEDGTLTAVTSVITGQSVGDTFFGKTINEIKFQGEDGCTLFSMAFVKADGATVWQKTGNVRAPSAGATTTQTNLHCMTNIQVGKGDELKIAVTSA